MQSNYAYLVINLLSLAFPLAASWDKRFKYHKKFKALIIGIFAMMMLFIPWDVWFTAKGVWGFNPDYLSGLYLFNLPIEEWMFFICIPFSSIFIYECIRYYFPTHFISKLKGRLFSLVLGISLISLAIFYRELDYTFYNFLGCGILLFINALKPNKFLPAFFFSYLFVLIPFFAVNGVLTGSLIESPIVWYNNEENLGLRLFTIPIEDTVYGLFMLLLTFNFYQYTISKSTAE